MSRAPLLAAVLGLLSCGRDHLQREGSYGLVVTRVIRDDCQLAAHPDVFARDALKEAIRIQPRRIKSYLRLMATYLPTSVFRKTIRM